MEDIVIVEPKDYSQVVFEDVKEIYSDDVDFECVFTISDLLKVDEGDFVGIYKVGFKHSKECFTNSPIDVKQLDETRKIKLVITGDKIPKEDGEFYQLVYVSQGKVRGASTPFQFKRFTELVEKEEQVKPVPDMELINSKIQEIDTMFGNFDNLCDIYDACIEENERLVELVFEKEAQLKKETTQEETGKGDILKQISLNDQKGLRLKIKSLKDALDLLIKKKEDMELLTDDVTSVLKFETNSEEISEISSYLQSRIEDMSVLIKIMSENIIGLLKIKHEIKEREMLITEEMLGQNESISLAIGNTSRSQIIQKYILLGERLLAAEKSKESLLKKLTLATEELYKIKSEADNELVKSERRLLEENKKLVEEMNKLKVEYDSRIEQTNGSYYALSVANSHLESRIKTLEDQYRKEMRSLRSAMELLKKENRRLQENVDTKLSNYDYLNEKYAELKKRWTEVPKSTSEYSLDRDYFQLLKGNDAKLDKMVQSKLNQLQNDRYVNVYMQSKMNNNIEDLTTTAMEEVKLEDTMKPYHHLFKSLESNNDEYIKLEALNNSYEGRPTSCSNEQSFPYTYRQNLSGCFCGGNRITANDNCQCGPHCPICMLRFPREFPQSEFEEHINCHFAN